MSTTTTTAQCGRCGGFLDSRGACHRSDCPSRRSPDHNRLATELTGHAGTPPVTRPSPATTTTQAADPEARFQTLGLTPEDACRWTYGYRLGIDDAEALHRAAPDVDLGDYESPWLGSPSSDPRCEETILAALADGQLSRPEAIRAARATPRYLNRRAADRAAAIQRSGPTRTPLDAIGRVLDDVDRLRDSDLAALDSLVTDVESSAARLRARLEAAKGRRSVDPF